MKIDEKHMAMLSSTISWTMDGIEYKADQHHAVEIVQAHGRTSKLNDAATPWAKGRDTTAGDNEINQGGVALHRCI